MSHKQFYISFGSGIKLLSEQYYIKELGDHLTKLSFRKFCRALHVPLIYIGDHAYIEMNSFQLAMKAITRVGESDFFVSGSYPVRVGKKRPSSLPTDYVAQNLTPLLCELMACKAIGGLKMNSETKSAARKAAERMARAGLQHLPMKEQERFSKQALKDFSPIIDEAKATLKRDDASTTE